MRVSFDFEYHLCLGDNFDTQLNVGGGGESSRLTNYAAFMLGIVLPDSYSQSLANNYKWHSKVLNFQLDNFQHPSNESCSDDTSNAIKNEGESHEVGDTSTLKEMILYISLTFSGKELIF